MSELAVVDSSGWLEYFVDSDRANLFTPAIENVSQLIVPVITVYEVVKKLRRERGEAVALRAVAAMRAGRVVDVDLSLTLHAARQALPFADSLIYSTALRFGATLWTQDAHFAELPSVKFIAK